MIVLVVVAALVALLAIVLVVNAVRLKPTPVPDPLPPSDARGDDAAVARFQELLRCETVWDLHNPDADRSAFDEFVPLLRRLYPRVFDSLELELIDGYGISLLWKGADRALAPVVLMAHHDVVPADASEWAHDPFAADIADGKIRYDGININKISKADLRRSLGVVLQEVNLFTGTVMDNIRYGRLDATDEECIAAAKLANADSFITRLPDGYNTMLTGNGASLSQGQRQLISIARAAVADPPAMILDEATSSIDTRTEALVQQGMDNLMEGRTVLVIAHRLSTIRNSKAIMVLDHGRIIERGDHEDLIAQKGTYYQLYTGAFELE